VLAAWTIGIAIQAHSNFGLIAAGISRQAGAAGAEINALNARISRMPGVVRAASLAMTGFGLASAATFALGIKGAADMQNATLQAAMSMGRMGDTTAETLDKMKDLRMVAIDMSMMTGQSAADSMGVIARMASAGMSPEQIKAEYKPIAAFTDILHFNPKDRMAYGEAAALGASLVNDLRLFGEHESAYGLGLVAQLGYKSPHNITQLATQVRRMAPMLENVLPGDAEAKARTITNLAAWADRMGNLPFAGSAISQMITQMVEPRSKRVLKSLEALGVYDYEGRNRFFDQRTGTFDVMGALMQINQHMAQARADGTAGPAVQAMFGGTQNMVRIMSALTSPESMKAWNALQLQSQRMGDPVQWMTQAQQELMGNFSQQVSLLTSNFRTLSMEVVEPLLPAMTNFVHVLADGAGKLAVFFESHKQLAGIVGTAIGAIGAWTAVSVASGVSGVWAGLSALGRPHLGAFARLAGAGESVGEGAAGGAARLAAFLLALDPELWLAAAAIAGVGAAAVIATGHSKQLAKTIGTGIGSTVAWLQHDGMPMIQSAFAEGMQIVARQILAFFALLSDPKALLNAATLGFFDPHGTARQMLTYGTAAANAQYWAQQAGYAAGDRRNVAVPHVPGTITALPRPKSFDLRTPPPIDLRNLSPRGSPPEPTASSAGAMGGGINVTVNYHDHSMDDGPEAARARNAHARRVAERVAKEIAGSMRTLATRAMGSNPQTVGMSPMELSPSGA